MRRIGALGLLLLSAGCSSGSESGERAPGPVADAAPYAGCTPSPLSLPWTKTGKLGLLSATVVAATPEQPARHDNDWRVVIDAAELTSAETFMPVHDHAGVPAPSVQRGGATNRLTFDFMMRGPWEVRVNLVSAEGESDQVVFDVCVTE